MTVNELPIRILCKIAISSGLPFVGTYEEMFELVNDQDLLKSPDFAFQVDTLDLDDEIFFYSQTGSMSSGRCVGVDYSESKLDIKSGNGKIFTIGLEHVL